MPVVAFYYCCFLLVAYKRYNLSIISHESRGIKPGKLASMLFSMHVQDFQSFQFGSIRVCVRVRQNCVPKKGKKNHQMRSSYILLMEGRGRCRAFLCSVFVCFVCFLAFFLLPILRIIYFHLSKRPRLAQWGSAADFSLNCAHN